MHRWTLLLCAALGAGCQPPTSAPAAAAPGRAPAQAPVATVEEPKPAARTAAEAAPAASIPQRFQGRYALDEAACSTPGHASALGIAGGSVLLPQARAMAQQVEVDGAALSVQVVLDGRRRTLRYALSDGDRVLTEPDAGMRRERCQ